MYGMAMRAPISSVTLTAPRSQRTPKTRTQIRIRAAAVTTFAEPRQERSLYEILRVKRTASQREIKSAYRNLAKLYHPDSAAAEEEGDGLDFLDLHNAYETLSDPESRATYDLSLSFNLNLNLMGRSIRPRPRPSSPDFVAGGGYYPSRRWETDQCW